MRFRSQNEMVLDHMLQQGSITALEALREYGVSRLAARVSDLKWCAAACADRIAISPSPEIVKSWDESTNSQGRTCRYARYELRGLRSWAVIRREMGGK